MNTINDSTPAFAGTSVISATRIEARFSRCHLLMIRPGLKVALDSLRNVSGQNLQDLSVLNACWAKLASTAGRPKLRLDAFELAACIVGVRVTRKLVTRRYVRWPGSDSANFQRLFRALEALRKRAKRMWIAARGKTDFGYRSGSWKQSLRILRSHMKAAKPPSRPAKSNAWRRRTIDICARAAQNGLLDNNISEPSKSQLRRLVRLGLRYVRRNRTAFGVGTLLRDEELAMRYFGDFVSRRLTKETKHGC
jgi:hypothetical protein